MASDVSTSAEKPTDLLGSAWIKIAKKIYAKIKQDNLSLIAAGVAFYYLLAIFPLIGALVSVYGLMVDQQTLSQHMDLLIGVIPEQGRSLLEQQISSVINSGKSALTTGFIVSLLLTIWSGGKGAAALSTACNITYGEDDTRSFLRGALLRVSLTICTILFLVAVILTIVAVPLIVDLFFGNIISGTQSTIFTMPVLFLLFMVALSALYKYAPDRKSAKWKWLTPGSLFATVLLVIFSFLFNMYVTEYASYNQTYGSMGGVIVLLMWLYLASFIILIGAEINAAIELANRNDTTVGEQKPMGDRDAYVADNIRIK